jgi:hypothetical protein
MAEKKTKRRKPRDEEKADSPKAVPKTVYLVDAVGEVREHLVHHRLAPRKFLWPTILKQIAKQDSFDGHHADTILEAIRVFLKPLDDGTIISLWRQTETGMCDETEDECLFPPCCRMDLEMELLQEVTSLAWEEATGRRPKQSRGNSDDPEPDWD